MSLLSSARATWYFLNFGFPCPQAECQSLRVNNCRQLIAEVGVEAVRRDNICKTQCSFAFSTPPESIAPVTTLLPGVDSVLTAPLPPNPPQTPSQGPRSAQARPNLPRVPSPPLPPRPLPPLRAATPSASSSFFTSPTATRSASGGGLQVVNSGGGGTPTTNQGSGPPPPLATTSTGGQVNLGTINQIPGVGGNINGAVGAGPAGRQPRPLFKMPSLRLPNLSDFFGL